MFFHYMHPLLSPLGTFPLHSDAGGLACGIKACASSAQRRWGKSISTFTEDGLSLHSGDLQIIPVVKFQSKLWGLLWSRAQWVAQWHSSRREVSLIMYSGARYGFQITTKLIKLIFCSAFKEMTSFSLSGQFGDPRRAKMVASLNFRVRPSWEYQLSDSLAVELWADNLTCLSCSFPIWDTSSIYGAYPLTSKGCSLPASESGSWGGFLSREAH